MGDDGRMSSRPRAVRIGAVVLLLGALVACSGRASGAPVVRWYAKEEAGGSLADAAAACTKAAHGRYRIEQVPLPADADAQREQLVRRLAAEDRSIDLLNMDVVWTAEFANAGWIRPWTGAAAKAVTKGRLATAVKTATFDGKLYGAPLNTNTELLWYRTDLTKRPPATWSQMLSEAERLRRRMFQPLSRPAGPTCWEPPVDVLETEQEVLILAALPGVDLDAVKAVIEGDTLMMSGVRVLPRELETAVIHRLELPQGRFERRVPLPAGRYDGVRRLAANGCLLVSLRKAR